MKLNALWALRVYPVLQDQGHGKIFKITKKEHQYNPILALQNQEKAKNKSSYRFVAI